MLRPRLLLWQRPYYIVHRKIIAIHKFKNVRSIVFPNMARGIWLRNYQLHGSLQRIRQRQNRNNYFSNPNRALKNSQNDKKCTRVFETNSVRFFLFSIDVLFFSTRTVVTNTG